MFFGDGDDDGDGNDDDGNDGGGTVASLIDMSRTECNRSMAFAWCPCL